MSSAWCSAGWWRGAGASDLRHVVLDEWSRGSSGLHRRAPRANVVCVLVLLITGATAWRGIALLTAMLLLLLSAGLAWARVPVASALLRAAAVLSFTLPFAVLTFLAGDSARAGALILKSYVSALGVLLLVATTPTTMLLR